MQIRAYSNEHAAAVAALFHASVHAIDPSIYPREQLESWAPTPPDEAQWRERLARTRPWLAVADGRMVGFMELGADGRIGCAYTHPDWQGRGVAGASLAHIEAIAAARGLERLRVDASLVARPFFERRGFAMVRQNAVARNGQVLVNHTLEKRLGGRSGAHDRPAAGTMDNDNNGKGERQ